MVTLGDVQAACERLPAPSVRSFGHVVPSPTAAATAVPVVERDGSAVLVLTKRAAAMRLTRGYGVIPGGLVDIGETSAEAARRESSEELGVPAEAVSTLGRLDTFGPIVNGYVIDTYVVEVDADVVFAPPPEEV